MNTVTMFEIKTPDRNSLLPRHCFHCVSSTQWGVTANEILDCWHTGRRRSVQLLLEAKDQLCRDSALPSARVCEQLFCFSHFRMSNWYLMPLK